MSIDLRLGRGATVDIGLGHSAGVLQLRNARGHVVAGPAARVHRSTAPGGWYRLEATATTAALDGQRLPTAGPAAANRFVVAVRAGRVDLHAFVAGPASDQKALLLQRLAWIHTHTARNEHPLGTGLDGRLRFSPGWTRGFWPGSLWHAFDMTHNAMFERWAERATLDNMGAEKADTHDLGFMYEPSSAEAYDHLCGGGRQNRDCARLRRSALTAAGSLLKLAATNTATGTLPTRAATPCTGCLSRDEADTIVDSVMNLQLLFWATRVTGDSRYADVAARHAHAVARLMVRADGSTRSSMLTRRSTGELIRFQTHQGYRANSTWARGQAWAIYGFAAAAAALGDRELLAAAAHTARFVIARLPNATVPRYDYDAPAGSPHDVSAAVITAAGMLRLADACTTLGGCDPAPAAFRSYAGRLLRAALAGLRSRPPLGMLAHQVYRRGGRQRWDDDAELIFGLQYALEALNAQGSESR